MKNDEDHWLHLATQLAFETAWFERSQVIKPDGSEDRLLWGSLRPPEISIESPWSEIEPRKPVKTFSFSVGRGEPETLIGFTRGGGTARIIMQIGTARFASLWNELLSRPTAGVRFEIEAVVLTDDRKPMEARYAIPHERYQPYRLGDVTITVTDKLTSPEPPKVDLERWLREFGFMPEE